MTLEGKTAVITGASRGIGAALARLLHARGVNLGLASRSGDDLGLDGTVAETCDVRDLAALEHLCNSTADAFAASTSWSRTPASERTERSSTFHASTSTR